MSWGSDSLRYFNGTQIPIRAVQDFDHAMIHLGKGFTHSSLHASVAASGGTVNHLLRTGNSTVHMRVMQVAATEAPIYTYYYLNPTITVDGTPEVIGNNNMLSSNVSQCSLFRAPTIGADGTLIGQDVYPQIGGGGGNAGIVGQLAGGEWILPKNTEFLIRMVNNGNQIGDLNLTLFWYEPETGEV